jgi:hypothetical protein
VCTEKPGTPVFLIQVCQEFASVSPGDKWGTSFREQESHLNEDL